MAIDKNAFPELKPYQFLRIKDKYLSVLLEYITPVVLYRRKHSMFYDEPDVLPLATAKMRSSMGRVNVDKSKMYIWDLIQNRNEGVLEEVFKGSEKSGLVSGYKITNWECIMEQLDEMQIIAEVTEYAKKGSNLPDLHIDLNGIRCLQLALVEDLKTARTGKMVSRINRQIFICKLLISQCPDGKLKQYAERSSTGRLYIKGLNLQTAPKRIRSVALGKHYVYDFKACSFGVFVSLFHSICDMQGEDPYPCTIHLRDYIKNRERYRLKICRDMFWPTDMLVGQKPAEDVKRSKEYKQIKTAFTSLGFGAKPRAGYYKTNESDSGFTQTALTAIFKRWENGENVSVQTTKKFLEHDFVKPLVQEIKQITKVILEYCLKEDPNLELIDGKPFITELNKRPSKAKQLAHIYQGHEVQLLELLYSYSNENSTTLLLHDGLATTQKISNVNLVELKQEIHDRYKFIELGTPETKGAFHMQEQQRIDEHNKFIQEQERIAEVYNPSNSILSIHNKSDEDTTKELQAFNNYLKDLQIK